MTIKKTLVSFAIYKRKGMYSQQTDFFQDNSSKDILAELAEYDKLGAKTQVETVNGIPYFINQFWTARQRQAHRIHELSYRACFKPQLPAFFIERLTQPGDLVYDPFMGRGTTPIEAALRGRIPYGNDINPLSKALTEPRINPPSLNDIIKRLSEIPWSKFKTVKSKKLLTFYHPKTLAQIEGLRLWLKKRQTQNQMDQTDRWIRMTAMNRLTGHSSGFFSVYTLPPNQAVSIKSQKKINEKKQQKPPERDVPVIIAKKSATLLSQGCPQANQTLFLTELSHKTDQILPESVKLTITSPPFLDIVNYEADNWLRCWFLGINPKSIPITRHKNIEEWSAFISKTLVELGRVSCLGAYVAFEVGEVRKGTVRLEEHVISASKGMPFETLGVVINRQKFTKTANCWGVSNNKSGTNSNRIVLLRKI